MTIDPAKLARQRVDSRLDRKERAHAGVVRMVDRDPSAVTLEQACWAYASAPKNSEAKAKAFALLKQKVNEVRP